MLNFFKLTVLILVISNFASGQDNVVITEYYKDIYCSRKATEKKAKYIRVKMTQNDGTFCSILTNAKTNKLIKKECIKNNEPVGLWIDINGSEINYDFEVTYGSNNNKLIEYDIKKKITKNPTNGVFMAPNFLAYDGNFNMYIANEVNYPEIARENNIQAKITFQFVISTEGILEQISIIEGNKYFDKDIVLLLRKSPKWSPATVDGSPVPVLVESVCNFKIN